MTRREGKESLTVHKQALAAEPKRLHKVRVVAAQRPLCIQRSAAPPQLLRDLATVAQQSAASGPSGRGSSPAVQPTIGLASASPIAVDTEVELGKKE